jgi:hypothetical protein
MDICPRPGHLGSGSPVLGGTRKSTQLGLTLRLKFQFGTNVPGLRAEQTQERQTPQSFSEKFSFLSVCCEELHKCSLFKGKRFYFETVS